ncbi:hypothetical protein [Xylanibacillus composti]|uniref:Uncharacterized protein n=1 Tax=Xylanibacillus composti TaxID=1572762 RepID=A0A8J4H3Q0_9BACL|nr:hypothetical protein [Xylanibacillus composti]GIQ70427.1 hypothetical protein XYCOK13_32510 [Xylanibacillus composti]
MEVEMEISWDDGNGKVEDGDGMKLGKERDVDGVGMTEMEK